MKRQKISFNGAKRLFTATADKVHPHNLQMKPMRGGWRI